MTQEPEAALVEAMALEIEDFSAPEGFSYSDFCRAAAEACVPIIRRHHEAEIAAAVDAERERCAKVARGIAKEFGERWIKLNDGKLEHERDYQNGRIAGYSDGADHIARLIESLASNHTPTPAADGVLETFDDAHTNWLANRPLRREDASKCRSPDLCWEYNVWVRCGPCALAATPSADNADARLCPESMSEAEWYEAQTPGPDFTPAATGAGLADELEAKVAASIKEADDIQYYSGGSQHNASKDALADFVIDNRRTILAHLRQPGDISGGPEA